MCKISFMFIRVNRDRPCIPEGFVCPIRRFVRRVRRAIDPGAKPALYGPAAWSARQYLRGFHATHIFTKRYSRLSIGDPLDVSSHVQGAVTRTFPHVCGQGERVGHIRRSFERSVATVNGEDVGYIHLRNITPVVGLRVLPDITTPLIVPFFRFDHIEVYLDLLEVGKWAEEVKSPPYFLSPDRCADLVL
jgi:hypothetical protein